MTVREKLAALREKMTAYKMDMYLIGSEDFHGSEYVGEHFKCRAFISGFTGSAGTILVTQDFAGLWTDGRYFLQAEAQLADTGIELFKMGNEGVPTIEDYIVSHIEKGQCLGFDGRTVNARNGQDYVRRLSEKGASVNGRYDLVDEIWTGASVTFCRACMAVGYCLCRPVQRGQNCPDPSGNGREESGLVCTDFSG